MRVERVDGSGDPGAVARRIRAFAPGADTVEEPVREIVARVRAGGDAALQDLTRELDTDGADPQPVAATADDLRRALDAQPPDLIASLEVARENVREVASAWLRDDTEVTLAQGHVVQLAERPVARAAVYVPGGRAPYPSTVVMGVETALAAGVEAVAVCSPPGAGGDVDPVVAAAAALCGATTLYRMGGAQAIAALAYGTESVQPVDVIAGPGNLYVQEAKRLVSGVVGIDGFAGPSDLLVVIAAGADVHMAALDLLAQSEHGPASVVAAASADSALLDALAEEVTRLAAKRPTADPAACVLVDVPSAEAALALAEAFAPEHLQLIGEQAEALAPRVRSAGCLLVGPASGTAFGDYVAGSNHVLPTGGAARFASVLNPGHFRRRMAEVRIGGDAAAKLASAGATIARAEGFTVHAESMEARIRENEPS